MSTVRPQLRPAAFLDRDGVLVVDTGYVHLPEKAMWITGAEAAVSRLNRLGYLVFVVTNQSGVARGLYSEVAVQEFHDWMAVELAGVNARIDAFYHCPHHPDFGPAAYRRECDCRKPAPGMILRAIDEWPVDPARSFLIGDRESDIEAARRAGIVGHRFCGGELDEFIRKASS